MKKAKFIGWPTSIDWTQLEWGQHLKTVSFLALAFLTVFLFESSWGYKIDFVYGRAFHRYLILPLLYWFWVAVHAAISKPAPTQKSAGVVVAVAILIHLYFLLLQFLLENTASTLTANYFRHYANSTAVFYLLALSAYGFTRLRQLVDFSHPLNSVDSAKIPLAYLPFFLPFGLGPTQGSLLFIASLAISLSWPHLGAPLQWLKNRWEKSPEALFLVLLLAISGGMRLIAAYRLASMGADVVLTNADDPRSYYEGALKLFSGQKVGTWFSWGGMTILAGLMAIVGTEIMPLLLLQAALGSLVPLLVYFIAKRSFGVFIARLSGLFTALSQLLIFNSVNFTRESSAILLILVITLLLMRMEKITSVAKQFAYYLVVGGLAGQLSTIEPVFQPLVFLALAAGIFLHRQFSLKLRLVFLGLGIVSVFAAVSLLQAWATGVTGLHSRDPGAATAVATLYNPYSTELAKNGIIFIAAPIKSLIAFFASPWVNLKLFMLKLLFDFRGYFLESHTGAFDPVSLVRNSIFAANLIIYVYALGILGAVIGLYRLLAQRKYSSVLLTYLFPLGHAAFYIVLVLGHTRYRANVQAFFLIYLAVGVAYLIDVWRGNSIREISASKS